MNIITPIVPAVERGTYGLRLQHAERDAREGRVVKHDTGLHQGDHFTSDVLGFMSFVDHERY